VGCYRFAVQKADETRSHINNRRRAAGGMRDDIVAEAGR
ncbi:uncharacterized protein METZ01_LOCUS227380, partial [marine metagenome]